MVAHYLPELLGVEPYDVWELSAFLDAQAIELPLRNEGRTIAYHDSCHMLRELKISAPPRRLLERSGAQVVMLPRPDLCCGFGGTFSVRQPEISLAMADDKLGGVTAVGAEALVTADPGCLMHLRGRTREDRRGRRSSTSLPRSHGASLRERARQPPDRFREVARAKLADVRGRGGDRRRRWDAFARTASTRGRSSTTSRGSASERTEIRMKAVRIDRPVPGRVHGGARGAGRAGEGLRDRRGGLRVRRRGLPARTTRSSSPSRSRWRPRRSA